MSSYSCLFVVHYYRPMYNDSFALAIHIYASSIFFRLSHHGSPHFIFLARTSSMSPFATSKYVMTFPVFFFFFWYLHPQHFSAHTVIIPTFHRWIPKRHRVPMSATSSFLSCLFVCVCLFILASFQREPPSPTQSLIPMLLGVAIMLKLECDLRFFVFLCQPILFCEDYLNKLQSSA